MHGIGHLNFHLRNEFYFADVHVATNHSWLRAKRMNRKGVQGVQLSFASNSLWFKFWLRLERPGQYFSLLIWDLVLIQRSVLCRTLQLMIYGVETSV